jgi:hypothetical protein
MKIASPIFNAPNKEPRNDQLDSKKLLWDVANLIRSVHQCASRQHRNPQLFEINHPNDSTEMGEILSHHQWKFFFLAVSLPH